MPVHRGGLIQVILDGDYHGVAWFGRQSRAWKLAIYGNDLTA
jgi:hypothetical protein